MLIINLRIYFENLEEICIFFMNHIYPRWAPWELYFSVPMNLVCHCAEKNTAYIASSYHSLELGSKGIFHNVERVSLIFLGKGRSWTFVSDYMTVLITEQYAKGGTSSSFVFFFTIFIRKLKAQLQGKDQQTEKQVNRFIWHIKEKINY